MTATAQETPVLPRIVVLLATHDGREWLDEQLDSILNQQDVEVRVVAMDDASSDGTARLLEKRAEHEPRLTVLPERGHGGSAAKNFYRLLQHAEVGADELIALSDQDDIWRPRKLADHARLLRELEVNAVSSDVVAVYPGGRRSLIRKSDRQRELDYLFESSGPGSTFLFDQRVLRLVREALRGDTAHQVDAHDWLIYALARASGLRWHIDDTPTVEYRQHDRNVLGANNSWRSALHRLRLVRAHWHRRQSTLIARLSLDVADDRQRPRLQRALDLLGGTGPKTRIALSRCARQGRRRRRDRVALQLLILSGMW